MFAEQSHRLRRLARSGIEIAVCDSPLLLNIIYNQSEDKEVFDNIVLKEDSKYNNFNYLITRNKKFYAGADRIQDETKPVEDIERVVCIGKGKSKIIS